MIHPVAKLREDLVLHCFTCNCGTHGTYNNGYDKICPGCGDDCGYPTSARHSAELGVAGEKHTGKKYREVK